MKYILTGSSSGLGKAICRKLLSQDRTIFGISRTPAPPDIINSPNFSMINFDLGCDINSCSYQSLIENCFEFIGLEESFSLILNAASFYDSPERLTFNKLQKFFNVNVLSIMRLVQSFEVYNLKRILIINSVSGLIGQSSQHEYSACKHAVMGYSKSLSKSAKNKAYDVLTINPGGMKTELWDNYPDVNISDFLEPDIIANLCIQLLDIPQRIFIEDLKIIPPSDLGF